MAACEITLKNLNFQNLLEKTKLLYIGIGIFEVWKMILLGDWFYLETFPGAKVVRF